MERDRAVRSNKQESGKAQHNKKKEMVDKKRSK